MPSSAPASTTTPTGQRAAIYIRESALEATRPDRYGIPVQRDQCRAYCDENGYTVLDEYLDKGADSEELDRPEMNWLRRDIKVGNVDMVVIARYDRLARDSGLQNFLL